MTIRSRLRVWLLLGLAAFVCHIGNASSATEVIVSVPDQTLALLDQGKADRSISDFDIKIQNW